MMTEGRVREVIDGMSDDDLIDFATTCSNSGLRLCAEIELRKRHPSRKKLERKSNVREYESRASNNR